MNNLEKVNQDLLVKIDNFEEEIRLIDTLTKKYNELKKELKEAMLEYGKSIDAEQVKWTTNNGTKITLSIGHNAEYEEQLVERFNIDILKNDYPEIYEKCIEKSLEKIIVKNPTNDTLRITLPKEEK